MMASLHQLLLFLAVAVAVVTSSPVEKQDQTKVECPEDFSAIGNSCYYFSGDHSYEAKFDDAVLICEQMTPAEGGSVQLAVMGTDYLEYSYLADYILSRGISKAVFVGLTGGPGGNGDWTWLDGSPMPLSSSMWGCYDPVAWSCGGFEVDDAQPEPRVYLSTFDCDNRYEYYLCEYSPPA